MTICPPFALILYPIFTEPIGMKGIDTPQGEVCDLTFPALAPFGKKNMNNHFLANLYILYAFFCVVLLQVAL